MLDFRGVFEYKKQRFTGYSIGLITLDIRKDLIEVEVLYHLNNKKGFVVYKHPFIVEDGDVDIDMLLDKIYKLHY